MSNLKQNIDNKSKLLYPTKLKPRTGRKYNCQISFLKWAYTFLVLQLQLLLVSSLCGLFFPDYPCIVISDHGLDIVLATITDLNCVPVENFVKLAVGWEMLVG